MPIDTGMILTRDVILEEVRSGNIVVDPFDPALVGPASVDLHLGDEIRVMRTNGDPVDITDETDDPDYTERRPLDEPFLLLPGSTIHGITREKITLARNLCGWLEGRSRFARLGLMVHVTAGFVAPGVSNRQVLEISNVSSHLLNLHPGIRLCQLVIQRTEGEAVYQGRFARQDTL